MKKTLSLLLVLVLVFAVTAPTFALRVGVQEMEDELCLLDGNYILVSSEVIPLDCGGTIVITSYQEIPDFGRNERMSAFSSSSSFNFDINGWRTVASVNSVGGILWTFTVHGTFNIVPGVSVTCTRAWYSYTIENNNWRLLNADAWIYQGRWADASATFRRYFLGIPTADIVPLHIWVSFDVWGMMIFN